MLAGGGDTTITTALRARSTADEVLPGLAARRR